MNQPAPPTAEGGRRGETRRAATPYKDKLFLDELGKIRTHTLQFAFIFITTQQLLTREGNKKYVVCEW